MAKKSIETMRTRLAAERAKLVSALATDRADVSAAVLRSEMRQMLRGMKPLERVQLLLSEGCDSRMLAAVLEAPNISSGITEDVRAKVQHAAIENAHPGAADKLDDYDEAAALLDAAYQMARLTVHRACDFPSEKITGDFLDAAVPAVDKTKHDPAGAFQDFGNIAKAESAKAA